MTDCMLFENVFHKILYPFPELRNNVHDSDFVEDW